MEAQHYFYINEIFKFFNLGDLGHEYQHVTHMWFVIAIMSVGALFLVRGIRLIPAKGQNILEMIIEGLENFMLDITGPEGKAFFPFVATIFLFILISNLIGLVPGFYSPTANWNTTLALAICTFVVTHIIGFKFHGIKYFKHFFGPVLIMAPIMLPIELISHFVRVLSLSVRLMGNIFGKEMILGILFALAGLYLAPLPILFLGILVSLIQAVVFMLLSIVYFAGAMEEAH
jgi:F-type H+-transporting ATPase subunit a